MTTKPFRIMKGDPVDPRFLRYPVAVFPKFNGFRGYMKDGVVYTASNKPFKNKELQALFGHRDFEGLDGEFVVGDPADGHNSLEKTSSVVTSQKPIGDLRFYAFDWIGDLNMPFGERYYKLNKFSGMEGREYFKVMMAPFELAYNWADVQHIERRYVTLGWEGVITRDLAAPYKCGRSTAREAYMGKLKQFSDAEFRIVGWEERMHNGNEATVSETGRTKRSTAKAGKTGRGDLGDHGRGAAAARPARGGDPECRHPCHLLTNRPDGELPVAQPRRAQPAQGLAACPAVQRHAVARPRL